MGQLVAALAALFAFWPQAGVLGQDLYYANSVDLDPAAGAVRDPFCGTRTYDTHSGIDVTIRSFREVQIGVPIFSVTDGTVTEVQDGFYDFRSGPTVSTFDNHVVIRAPDGRYFVYGHLRHGLKLKRGDAVHAGEQIGWNGSSGNSSWPHLHFTELVGDTPRDPFAGPCNPGDSDFAAQPRPFRDAPYVRNLVVSAKPFVGKAQLPWDEAARTGTFLRGTRDVYVRIELGEYAPGDERIQIVRPDGTVAVDDATPAATPDGVGQGHGQAAFDVHERVAFTTLGTWRLRYSLGGVVLVDAPLRVAIRVRNRPPSRITATLLAGGGIAQCLVGTTLAFRDPDYDIVRYRYQWSAGAKVLRVVTSAALSDAFPARPGLRCDVTPSDGKLTSATASARLP